MTDACETQSGGENVTENVTDNVTENVTENEAKIVELIRRNPFITANEMASFLGVTRMTISRIINKLKERGAIVRVNGDKGGRWEIIGR